MQYIAQANQPVQWYYRIRLLKCDRNPWLVGLNDDIFEAESRFVVDNTLIGD
jgi:hypothetical protein